MTIDFDSMTKEELLDLQKNVDKALKTLDSRRKAEAKRAADAAARQFGFSIDELLGDSTKGGSKGVPKYAHPENPDLTWTGRGRKPNWVNDWVNAGKSLDDLAI